MLQYKNYGTHSKTNSTKIWTRTNHQNSSALKQVYQINHEIRKMFKKKTRLYQQAKITNNWSNDKHFQKECKRQVQKAEWGYINNTIMEGLENNNPKPFWKYIKLRKQDNIGISPLKSNGHLVNDRKGKAELLIQQFKSVFTRDNDKTVPKTTKNIKNSIQSLKT
ncbi:unnamed protein product [Mytilus coruscus]|uniref:Uncharacterized protein n=1 Tax=Mytilus coruscus TaxID=42192 RepID=A0A6J8B1T5_MYTCO|nr:unnamed protein product [Mytilus coruscus]